MPRCPICGSPVIVVLAGERRMLFCPDCHDRWRDGRAFPIDGRVGSDPSAFRRPEPVTHGPSRPPRIA